VNPGDKSKPLRKGDESAADFVMEMLAGDPTFGINFDRIQWDNVTNRYVIVEFLLTEERDDVDPWTSHPNRYFLKNARKFQSLWELAKQFDAALVLVNYAKKGTKHENKVKLMEVVNVNPQSTTPVVTRDKLMTREEFSKWFRILNQRGQRPL
jgi:hypothetical protein